MTAHADSFSPTSESPIIVVVDDDPHVRLSLVRMLRDLTPLEIVDVECGQAAWEILLKRPCAYLFVDYYLTDMSGPEVLRHPNVAARHPVTVLMTGDMVDDEGIADYYLLKPFSSSKLEAILQLKA